MSAQQDFRARSSGRMTLALRLLHAAASRLRYGRLEIRYPGREPVTFTGAEAGPSGVLDIRDPGMFRRILSRGDLGFAEAWMDGQWTTPDLAALLGCMERNLEAFTALERGRAVMRWFKALRQRLLFRNNRSGSRRNIAYHYDLGNDFYRLWLDWSMTYSSACFETDDDGLADAQQHKYQRLLAMTGAGPDDHILEIGCGWGGFAIHAARTLGCRVTGLTLSREQHEWAWQQVRENGLEGRVDIRLQDYRDVTETFDHIVSIEMFEAVGESYWPVFFQTLHDRLRPGGRAALQVITIDDAIFDRYRRDVDFIREYVFPGGVLPSPEAFGKLSEEAGLVTVERHFRGTDYARTLAGWAERFRSVEPAVLKQGFDHRFIRMWQYYLAYCEAGFRSGRIDLMQTVVQRDG